MRWAALGIGSLLLCACAPTVNVNLPAPAGTPISTSPPSRSPESSPTPTGAPTTTPPPTATPTTEQARPAGPQTLRLSYGQTARLRYFDVTALRQEFGKDRISIGWKVRVCYAAPHPEAGSDGRTRVSNNPWSVRVRDGEGGGQAKTVPISSLPRDAGWVPEFRETRLALGECQEGWLPVKHENPDLQWNGLTYAPADFGDRITWS